METMPSYTMREIPADFLNSAVGRSLGVHGADAQKLGLYLLANPYLATSGDYDLPQAALIAHLQMESERIEALLEKLNDCGFCTYDFRAERVTVPLVAQIYTALLDQASPEEAVPPRPAEQERSR